MPRKLAHNRLSKEVSTSSHALLSMLRGFMSSPAGKEAWAAVERKMVGGQPSVPRQASSSKDIGGDNEDQKAVSGDAPSAGEQPAMPHPAAGLLPSLTAAQAMLIYSDVNNGKFLKGTLSEPFSL